MILFNDYQKKLVVPRWLSHKNATKTGELGWPAVKLVDKPVNNADRFAIDYSDFKNDPSLHKASDLLGSAFVLGEKPLAEELAKYILSNPTLSAAAIGLAKQVLGISESKPAEDYINLRISEIKRFLSEHPTNPFKWMERGRLYTLMGLMDKAEKCVRIAYNLAPYDRYVARCATRFFLHVDKTDEAWHYIHNASKKTNDPWIKATEISIGELLNKNFKKPKQYMPTSNDPRILYHYSEFIEAYGMLELVSGNDHMAKKLFKTAWSNPSVNVVTHSEWIVRERFPALIEMAKGHFRDSIEAVAWQHYHNLNIDSAIVATTEWGLAEPYAKNAFGLGSSLFFNKRDYVAGVKTARFGLISNPNDFGLLNNVCFGLLKQRDINGAVKVFDKIIMPDNPTSQVVYTATRGLMYYVRGEPAIGRSLYVEAIEKAKAIKDTRLAVKALLHLAATEAEFKTPEAQLIAEIAIKSSESYIDPDVEYLKRNVKNDINELSKVTKPTPFGAFHNVKIPPSIGF